MRKAGDILRAILDESSINEAQTYSSFFRSWTKVAGQDIAAHSQVSDVTGGVVVIEADHPGWLQMIQLRRREILQKIQSLYPELGIRELRFFLQQDLKDRARPPGVSVTAPGSETSTDTSRDIPQGVPGAKDAPSATPEAAASGKRAGKGGYREFRALLRRIRADKDEDATP